jgi:hypothetical protein
MQRTLKTVETDPSLPIRSMGYKTPLEDTEAASKKNNPTKSILPVLTDESKWLRTKSAAVLTLQ